MQESPSPPASRNSDSLPEDQHDLILEYLAKKDHNSLALIARTKGIPLQLRYRVWPILLKYHPFVVSPNIVSNTLTEDSLEAESREEDELREIVEHDLLKYFYSARRSLNLTEDEAHIVRVLTAAVVKFVLKWGQIFKYESGLVWVALGLAEWFPAVGDLVLNGKHRKSVPSSNRSSRRNSQSSLEIVTVDPTNDGENWSFAQVYERLVLCILHCPTGEYNPIRGGDVQYRQGLFFKVFGTVLPELYQPFNDEEGADSHSWMYWWIKFCGCKILTKLDRGRVWDILLGWRPAPGNIQFYLPYNKKNLPKLYRTDSIDVVESDMFWFPDLEGLALHENDNVLEMIMKRNKGEPVEELAGVDVTSSYSLLDPHVEIMFLFLSILQKNEFKLLEYEHAEIKEFLNNLPLLSRYNNLALEDEVPVKKIEFGTDEVKSHGFEGVFRNAGDIWRKWMWVELLEIQ